MGVLDGTVRTRSLLWFALGAVATLLVTLTATRAWEAGAADEADSTFVAISPCRLFDLRPGAPNVGERSAALGPDESYPVTVVGNQGECSGIPGDATGVALNVTVVDPTAASFLSVVPGDVPGNPGVSSLNYQAGAPPTPNKVDVALDDQGRIRLYNFAGNVFVLADVVGYYVPSGRVAVDHRTSENADVTGAWTEVGFVSVPDSPNRRAVVFATAELNETIDGQLVECGIGDGNQIGPRSEDTYGWEVADGGGDINTITVQAEFTDIFTAYLYCRNANGGSSAVQNIKMTVIAD